MTAALQSRNRVDGQIHRRDAKSAEKICSHPANNLDYCNAEKTATRASASVASLRLIALGECAQAVTSLGDSSTKQKKQVGLGILLGGVLLVLGWRGVVVGTRWFKEPELLREFGSVRQFVQDVIPNSANTRLVFCQDTPDGIGIYFCDAAGGKPRLLCEQKELGHSWKRFTMLGWAPDDSLFACGFPDTKRNQELILIFDGRTGEPAGQVVADENLYHLAWLSTNAFAYSSRTFVRVVTRQANGSWSHSRYFQDVAASIEDFTAVSATSVAWRDGRGICLLDMGTGSAEKLWEATTNRLVEFTYAGDADEFLLNCSDQEGQYLLRLRLGEKRATMLERIGSQQDYIRNAVWSRSAHAASYACLTNAPAGSAFCIKAAGAAAPAVIPWHGGVRSLTLSGGQLFFSGYPDDQAPGIWKYDLASETFNCIVPGTSGPCKNNLGQPATVAVMTNSLGEQRFYHLWTPRHVAPSRKYPLLLAQELNTWFPCFQVAALRGCYVAVVDRPFFNTWNGTFEHTWAEDVGSLYEIMAQNPSVDTNRVYLYACSAETFYLTRLMAQRPGLAKGAILFSPGALPNPASLHNSRFLIADGSADGDAPKRLPEFQDRAAAEGNEITLFFQAGASHMVASGGAEHNRANLLYRFLSDSR